MKDNTGKKKLDKSQGKSNIWELHKKEIIIGSVIVAIFLILILSLILTKKPSSDNKPSNNSGNTSLNNEEPNYTTDTKYVTEEDLIKVYSFSKEDACNLVKEKEFNTDNFKFSAVISADAKYIVTATNIINNTKYFIEVDPASKTYQFMN